MSFFGQKLRATVPGLPPTPPIWDDYWYRPRDWRGRFASAGMRISPTTAMALSAVYCATEHISNALAMIPLKTYEWLPDGSKQVAKDYRLYDVLHDQPNSIHTSFEFRKYMQKSLLLRGNAYAKIVPGARGFADQLEPLFPDYVTPRKTSDGLMYRVAYPDGHVETLVQDEVFHLRQYSDDGIVGQSAIFHGVHSMGVAYAAQDSAGSWYRNAAQLSGILTTPNKLNTDAYEAMSKEVREVWQGSQNAGGIPFLDQDTKFMPISVSAKDAELLESRKWQVNDVARWFMIPPHMVGDLERATFSNIEQQSLEFVTYTMMPWYVLWEQGITRDLILPSERFKYFAEFVVAGLLRGDMKSRYDTYAIGIQNEIISPNEARGMENMNAYSGGERFGNRNTQSGAQVPVGPGNPAKSGNNPNAEISDDRLRAIVREEMALRDASVHILGHRNGHNGHLEAGR